MFTVAFPTILSDPFDITYLIIVTRHETPSNERVTPNYIYIYIDVSDICNTSSPDEHGTLGYDFFTFPTFGMMDRFLPQYFEMLEIVCVLDDLIAFNFCLLRTFSPSSW